jgi:hypothetical protein
MLQFNYTSLHAALAVCSLTRHLKRSASYRLARASMPKTRAMHVETAVIVGRNSMT